MPQPYRGKEKVVFGKDVLIKRPLVAAHIAEVAHRWTMIEEIWGMILADMLEGEARAGMAIYLELTGTGAHNTVLNTIADIRLTGDQRIEFGRLVGLQRPRAEERNRVVHGRWGYLPSRDGVLILGERNWLPRSVAAINHHYATAFRGIAAVLPFENAPMKRLVYKTQDFLDIQTRMEEFRLELSALHDLIIKARGDRRQLAGALSSYRVPPPQSVPLGGLLGLVQATPANLPSEPLGPDVAAPDEPPEP